MEEKVSCWSGATAIAMTCRHHLCECHGAGSWKRSLGCTIGGMGDNWNGKRRPFIYIYYIYIYILFFFLTFCFILRFKFHTERMFKSGCSRQTQTQSGHHPAQKPWTKSSLSRLSLLASAWFSNRWPYALPVFLEYQLAAVFGSIALARSVCLVLPGSSACGSKCARCAVCLWVKSVCIHSCLWGSFFVPVRIFFVPSACCPCSRDGSAFAFLFPSDGCMAGCHCSFDLQSMDPSLC